MGVGLLVLGLEVGLGRVVAEAAGVDPQHVDRGLALGDPLGELPAGAAGRGDAEAVALVQPEVAKAPGRADDRAAVRRIRNRTVVNPLHPDLAERRHPVDRSLDMRRQALEVVCEQLVFGIFARAVRVAAGRSLLVRPEQQAARLLAQVPGAVALAQHPHLGQAPLVTRNDLRMRLGHDILVLDRHHRHVEADHGAGPAREIAGGADHMLGQDVTLVGPDQPLAGGLLADAGDPGLAVDLGAALARSFGQRLGDVGRLDVAILRMADRADDAVDVAERPDLLDLPGRQELDLNADRRGHARVLVILVHAVPVEGETDVRDLGEADVLAGLRLEGLVEGDRVFVDLADRVAHVEERQKARRVPGRAGGQLLALDQDHVRPALFRKVIKRRDPDRTTADHHHPRLRFHDPPPALPPRPALPGLPSAEPYRRLGPGVQPLPQSGTGSAHQLMAMVARLRQAGPAGRGRGHAAASP